MNNRAKKIQLSSVSDNYLSRSFLHMLYRYITIYETEVKNKNYGTSNSESNRVYKGISTSRLDSKRFYKNLSFSNLNEIIEYNENVRNQVVDEWVVKLVQRMKFYSYDQESEETIWQVIDEEPQIPISILGMIFQKICMQNIDCPNILCAVAKCLCSYDLIQTAEWGPMILSILLNHKNDIVKEYAVFLLENWEDRSLLPLLRNLDFNTLWLKEYVNSVIYNIEGRDVLR